MSPNLSAVVADVDQPMVRLVTVQEVARRIGFPASRVLQQIRSGNVQAYCIAGRVTVLRAEEIERVRDMIITTLESGPTAAALARPVWNRRLAEAS